MTSFKQTSCRLCLKNITEKGFQIVDDVTRNILDVLLLKLKFHGDTKEVICNTCRRKLSAAYAFKSTCLNTNNMIIPHANHEKILQLDLGEIYVKENGSGHLMDIFCDHKMCLLCKQLIKGEIRRVGEEELEAIHKLVPEMNIIIIEDPVACKPCFDSLCTHNTFLNNCLEVEQRIGDIFDNSTADSQIDTSPTELFIKSEDLEINEMEMAIKTECVDIKSEDEGSKELLLHSNNETFENSDYKDAEEGFKHTQKYNSKSTGKYVKHKNVLEVYKCDACEYITEKKSLLKRHTFKHKNPAEVQMYTCNDCDYTTKYKNKLVYHRLQHKDPSQVQMYKCPACDYESIYKDNFTKHQLMHKNPSEVQMYKCDVCDYETKYKNGLAYHVLQHKDPSEIRIYKCDACDYESRHKKNFTQHQLTHKDLSEVQMYTCNKCDYKTKYKNCLECHVLRHQDPSQVQMYKCKECDYESKYKNNVIKHSKLIHKDPSEVQVYKCNECNYKSKYSCSLALHVLRHKDPSQVQMYKCDACQYESRYKNNVIKHQLTHKNASEVQMYKCDTCNYETKYKQNLKCHEWNHKMQP